MKEMAKSESSCLAAHYYSIIPFSYGSETEEKYARYRLTPVYDSSVSNGYEGSPFDNKNYLALDLERRLRAEKAEFILEVQITTDKDKLDKAAQDWDIAWFPVAKITFEQQDIKDLGQSEYGENLAFNIWRTPMANRPHGSIAHVRKVVYEASAKERRKVNGAQIVYDEDNIYMRPKHISVARDQNDKEIVAAAIYPPIGVCRVGNSEQCYWIGPEVPHPVYDENHNPLDNSGDIIKYRDDQGRITRQAARFRVYGLNAYGVPVKELTADEADITWQVQLGNQKSSWYEFELAQDIPESKTGAIQPMQRNGNITEREKLKIIAKSKEITGKNASGEQTKFDDGTFMGKSVYLGELRTDEKGRLIVLGGYGVSKSCDETIAVTFGNNEGWCDDIADGPVTATVQFEGADLNVTPAWVISAPPNYAPQLKSVRTMWDLMRDVAISNGMLERPVRPSFNEDIRPLFERMTALQWVNKGFSNGFGHNAPFNYTSKEWMEKLNDTSPANMGLRRTLAHNFRNEKNDIKSMTPWPWIYGDAMYAGETSPRQMLQLSDYQLWALSEWVNGNFEADYCDECALPQRIEDYPVEEQPDILTKAAMDYCLADAFHPGCEMTWPMRNGAMYSSAFRLKHRTQLPEPYYGVNFDQECLQLAYGPIAGGQTPGSITRWMAVPWQTDTASCRSGYDKTYDPYLPTFWPARVPNQVMTEHEYQRVTDTSLSNQQRAEAFAYRKDWLETLGESKEQSTQQLSGYTADINAMINHFDDCGIVLPKQGGEGYPERIFVSDKEKKT